MRKFALALLLLFVASSAHAYLLQHPNTYWGVAPGYGKIGDDANLGTVSALVGYSLHPHIGIEGRVGTTMLRHDEDVLDERHKTGVDFLGSAFLRLNVLTGDVRPYALLGGTYAKASTSGPYIRASQEESDFSWGAGISLHVREHGFYLEYVSHLDKGDVEFWGVNLGYLGRF